ncbi:MAG: class I SAM-dependent methyltransferase [Chloroflexi bacterium]|nr:MAG: class I SAM-dependent methyltransferase [Chloroflexota bacterium]
MRRLGRALLRFFFRLLYHECAWAYDPVAWVVSLGQWNAWVRTAMPHLRGEIVLEVAHGPGHLLGALKERGLSPVGLDLSPQMGRLARRRLRQRGLSVPLVRARAQALPFSDACFDSAVVTFPTEFILHPATLRESWRVLRPRGRLVVVAWARLSERDPLSRFLGWLYRVTGQGEPLPTGDEAVIVKAGFIPHTVWEPVGRSRVMTIVAIKR